MNVLEKILKEIEEKTIIVATSKEHYNQPQNGEFVEEVITIKNVEDIIRSHMDELPNGIKEVSKEQLNQIPVATPEFLQECKATAEKYNVGLCDEEIQMVMDALSGTPICTTAEFADKIEKILRRDINKWTPVSELPKEKGWYLCTCSNKDIWGEDIVRDLYYYPALKQFVDNIRYEASGLKDVEKFYWTRYVTAWQPLPEPHKGKENQTR